MWHSIHSACILQACHHKSKNCQCMDFMLMAAELLTVPAAACRLSSTEPAMQRRPPSTDVSEQTCTKNWQAEANTRTCTRFRCASNSAERRGSACGAALPQASTRGRLHSRACQHGRLTSLTTLERFKTSFSLKIQSWSCSQVSSNRFQHVGRCQCGRCCGGATPQRWPRRAAAGRRSSGHECIPAPLRPLSRVMLT